jgi:hypothetical protein
MAKSGSYAMDVFRKESSGAKGILLRHLGMGELCDVGLKVFGAVRRKAREDLVELV